MKRKYLSIYFPHWSINRIQSKLSVEQVRKGVLLTVKKNGQEIVARCCGIARNTRAIREGSTLSLARAFLPHATVQRLNSTSDFNRLYKAAVYHTKFTPIVGLDPQTLDAYKSKTLEHLDNLFFGLNMDLTGTERLFNEKTLLKALNTTFLKSRVEARIAIAPTLGLAWALSRFSANRISIVHDKPFTPLMEKLPIESLRISSSVSEALHEVGINNVLLLSTLPRKTLLTRYGNECLKRLDQLTGEVTETVTPIYIPDNWTVLREFEFPLLNHETISRSVIALLQELFSALRAKGRTSRTFILLMIAEEPCGVMYRDSKEFAFYSATTDEKHLQAVVFPLVENLKVTGPIHALMLTAKNIVKTEPEQFAFDKEYENRLAKEELLNFFVSKLGEANVTNIQFTEQYLPEHSFNFTSVVSKDDLNTQCHLADRPSVILDAVHELKAITALPDSYPARLYWNGAELKILSGTGPERIEAPSSAYRQNEIRDYFKVQDHLGRWLWVYRNIETQQWFLQGMWI